MNIIRSAMIIALDVENSHWRSTTFHSSYFWPEAAMADDDDLSFPSSTDPSSLVTDQAAHLLPSSQCVPLGKRFVGPQTSCETLGTDKRITQGKTSTSRSIVWNVARHQQNVMLRFLRRLFYWSLRTFITFMVNQHPMMIPA